MNIDQSLYSLEGIILGEKVIAIYVPEARKGTHYAIVPRIAENKNTIKVTPESQRICRSEHIATQQP